MPNEIVNIDNHYEQAIDRLPDQYREREKIYPGGFSGWEGMIHCLVKNAQNMENVMQSMLDQRSLESSEGVNLDRIGEIVGADRGGLNDTEYLEEIEDRIVINNSDGTASDIIFVADTYLQADSYQYMDVKHAKFKFVMQNPTFPQSPRLYKVLDEAKVAGVGYKFINDLTTNYFSFTEGAFTEDTEVTPSSSSTTGENLGGEFAPGSIGEKFVAPRSGTVLSAKSRIWTVGGIGIVNVRAQIWTSTGTLPDTLVGQSNVIVAATLPTSQDGTDTTFTFPTPPPISYGSEYFLVITKDVGQDTGQFRLQSETGGDHVFYNGATWSTVAGKNITGLSFILEADTADPEVGGYGVLQMDRYDFQFSEEALSSTSRIEAGDYSRRVSTLAFENGSGLGFTSVGSGIAQTFQTPFAGIKSVTFTGLTAHPSPAAVGTIRAVIYDNIDGGTLIAQSSNTVNLADLTLGEPAYRAPAKAFTFDFLGTMLTPNTNYDFGIVIETISAGTFDVRNDSTQPYASGTKYSFNGGTTWTPYSRNVNIIVEEGIDATPFDNGVSVQYGIAPFSTGDIGGGTFTADARPISAIGTTAYARADGAATGNIRGEIWSITGTQPSWTPATLLYISDNIIDVTTIGIGLNVPVAEIIFNFTGVSLTPGTHYYFGVNKVSGAGNTIGNLSTTDELPLEDYMFYFSGSWITGAADFQQKHYFLEADYSDDSYLSFQTYNDNPVPVAGGVDATVSFWYKFREQLLTIMGATGGHLKLRDKSNVVWEIVSDSSLYSNIYKPDENSHLMELALVEADVTVTKDSGGGAVASTALELKNDFDGFLVADVQDYIDNNHYGVVESDTITTYETEAGRYITVVTGE